MNTERTLIIGEAPGRFAGGLTRQRLTDFSGADWEDWADWLNLLDETQPLRAKGSSWNPNRAKAAASALIDDGTLDQYDTVVLLGRRVAAAVIPGGAGFPFFRWTTLRGTTARLVVIPHTSGIVRSWNDPAIVERAREILAALARHPNTKEAEMAASTATRGEGTKRTASRAPRAPKDAPPAEAATSSKKTEPATPSDVELMVAAFRASPEPLTPKEAASVVIESGLARPASAKVPVEYRLYAPVYRSAKAGNLYRKVADKPHSTFEVLPDVPASDAAVLRALKPLARKALKNARRTKRRA